MTTNHHDNDGLDEFCECQVPGEPCPFHNFDPRDEL